MAIKHLRHKKERRRKVKIIKTQEDKVRRIPYLPKAVHQASPKRVDTFPLGLNGPSFRQRDKALFPSIQM